jgi:hypothetical protein
MAVFRRLSVARLEQIADGAHQGSSVGSQFDNPLLHDLFEEFFSTRLQ